MKHVIYIDEYFGENLTRICREQKSKVYGETSTRYPSGWKTLVKVWNTRLNKMVWVRKDNDIVAVID